MNISSGAIVVAQVGHHLDFSEAARPQLDRACAGLLPAIQQHRAMGAHFVWATMAPGHPECQAYTEPYTAYSQYNLTAETVPYPAWGAVLEASAYWKEKMAGLGAPILDTKPLLLRPDGHTFEPRKKNYVDCLHWGGPVGALSFLARPLQHILEHYIPRPTPL